MALELKKIFSILKNKLSVLNKGKTYVLVLRFFEEYIITEIGVSKLLKQTCTKHTVNVNVTCKVCAYNLCVQTKYLLHAYSLMHSDIYNFFLLFCLIMTLTVEAVCSSDVCDLPNIIYFLSCLF